MFLGSAYPFAWDRTFNFICVLYSVKINNILLLFYHIKVGPRSLKGTWTECSRKNIKHASTSHDYEIIHKVRPSIDRPNKLKCFKPLELSYVTFALYLKYKDKLCFFAHKVCKLFRHIPSINLFVCIGISYSYKCNILDLWLLLFVLRRNFKIDVGEVWYLFDTQIDLTWIETGYFYVFITRAPPTDTSSV